MILAGGAVGERPGAALPAPHCGEDCDEGAGQLVLRPAALQAAAKDAVQMSVTL